MPTERKKKVISPPRPLFVVCPNLFQVYSHVYQIQYTVMFSKCMMSVWYSQMAVLCIYFYMYLAEKHIQPSVRIVHIPFNRAVYVFFFCRLHSSATSTSVIYECQGPSQEWSVEDSECRVLFLIFGHSCGLTVL